MTDDHQSDWSHRICERCWFDSDMGVLETGAYRMPVQDKEAQPGPCCLCGGMTITGIYRREDPNGLPCAGEHVDWSWSRVGR